MALGQRREVQLKGLPAELAAAIDLQATVPAEITNIREVNKLKKLLDEHEKEASDLLIDLSSLPSAPPEEMKTLLAYHEKLRSVQKQLVPLHLTALARVAPRMCSQFDEALERARKLVAPADSQEGK